MEVRVEGRLRTCKDATKFGGGEGGGGVMKYTSLSSSSSDSPAASRRLHVLGCRSVEAGDPI